MDFIKGTDATQVEMDGVPPPPPKRGIPTDASRTQNVFQVHTVRTGNVEGFSAFF